MPYKLNRLPDEPIVVLSLLGHIDGNTLEAALEDSSQQVEVVHSLCGYVMDWTGALPLPQQDGKYVVGAIGTWLLDLQQLYDIIPVWVCTSSEVSLVSEWVKANNMTLPVFDNFTSATSYLNLKLASQRLKENMSQLETHTLDVDSKLHLQILAAAKEAEEMEDETSKVYVGNVMRLEAVDFDKSMLLVPNSKKGIVLGRRDAKGGRPDIDLSLWAGSQSGVSRQHAEVQQAEDGVLFIRDLESTNGTYINGSRLKPLQFYQLREGDEVRLGSLVVKVSFGAG